MHLISFFFLARCIFAKEQDSNQSYAQPSKRYYQPHTFFDVALLSKKDFIEQHLSIDEHRLPYRDVVRKEAMPCWRDFGLGIFSGCVVASFKDRYTMYEATTKFSAFYNVYVEGETTSASNPSYITVSRSHSTTTALSAGWSLGIHGHLNPLGFIGGSVSNEINIQGTWSNTYVSEYSNTFTCPAWHNCQVQTLTWHVTMSGRCDWDSVITCGDVDIRPCHEGNTCPDYWSFAKSACRNVLLQPCNVTAPLFKGPGVPYSEVKFREFDTRPHFRRCLGPHAVLHSAEVYDPETEMYSMGEGWFKKPPGSPPPVLPSPYPCVPEGTREVPQVIGMRERWCELDDGDLYAAESDEYFNTVKGEWYTRPGALKPDVADFGPCLKSPS